MAWRIHETVIRGEIDNRMRDRITGRLWLVGRPAPIELDLAGNAWRDLAGRRLVFVNPEPKPGQLDGFGALQAGLIGDCTASRKVKVPDIPLEQIGEYYAARKKWPWHWGNSLYLEWFANGNGRVVIESTTFQLTIDPDLVWEMTSAEDDLQRRANVEAMSASFEALADAAPPDAGAKPPSEDTILDSPAEDFFSASSDAPDEPANDDAQNDDADLALALPARSHPLVTHASELRFVLLQQAETRGWIPLGASEEHPVADLVHSIHDGARKLAGALNRPDWPPSPLLIDDTLERLRRARRYFNHALLALAYCVQEKLADIEWLRDAQRELNTLCHRCNLLIAELCPPQQPSSD